MVQYFNVAIFITWSYISYKLYKTFNEHIPHDDWIDLNFAQINTTSQTTFITTLVKNCNIGYNILNNKFYTLNRQILLAWFNKSINSFKVTCKSKFLTYNWITFMQMTSQYSNWYLIFLNCNLFYVEIYTYEKNEFLVRKYIMHVLSRFSRMW